MTAWRFDYVERPARARPGARPDPGGLVAGRFRLQGELGRGGLGVVHRALDTETGVVVALKVLRGSLTPEGRERLRREGAAAASLDHPGIVKLRAAGESEEGPFLAYELVPGARTLDEVLPGLDRLRRLALFRDLAAAVAHAHGRGVVHRDLKEANVLVDGEGRARLIDFGIAWTRDAGSLTESGQLLGTPQCMAPEQLAGERSMREPPTDVWALGVLLYVFLAGERPYPAESLVRLMEAVATTTPRPLREHDPTISAALARVAERCLARSPADRYPDAGALLADLDRALAGRAAAGRSRIARFASPALVGLGVVAGVLVAGRSASRSAGERSAGDPEPLAAPTSATARPTDERSPETNPTPPSETLGEVALEAALRRAPERAERAVALARHLLLERHDARAALIPLAGRELAAGAGEELRRLLVAVTLAPDEGHARASSTIPGWPVEHLLDGDPFTLWSSVAARDASAEEWLQVDLGLARRIGGIRLHSRPDGEGFPAALAVEGSLDGCAWSALPATDTIVRPAAFGWHALPLDAPATARLVRVRATRLGLDRYHNFYFQLAGIDVLDPAGAPIAPTLGTPLDVAGAPPALRQAARLWLLALAERETAFVEEARRKGVLDPGREARVRRTLALLDAGGLALASGAAEGARVASVRERLAAVAPRPPRVLEHGVKDRLLATALAVEKEARSTPEDLLAAVEDAVREVPEDVELRERPAFLLLRSGRLARAEVEIETVLAEASDRGAAHLLPVLLLGARHAPESAVRAAYRSARAHGFAPPPASEATRHPELEGYELELR